MSTRIKLRIFYLFSVVKCLFLLCFAVLSLHCFVWLFLVAAGGGCSPSSCTFLILVASLVAHRLQVPGLQELQHMGSAVAVRGPERTRASVIVALWFIVATCRLQNAEQLWYADVVASQCVESLQTRDRTCVLCIAGGFLSALPPGKSKLKLF